MSESTTAFDTGKLRADAQADYRKAVEAAARGKAPGKKLQAVLWAAGRNLEGFDADVSRLRARFDAAEAVATRPAVQSEYEAVKGEEASAEAGLREAEAEAERLLAEARAVLAQAQQRRRDVKERLRTLEAARLRLLTTAAPRLRKQIANTETMMVHPADALRALPQAQRILAALEARLAAADGRPTEHDRGSLARCRAAVQAGEDAERRLPGLQTRLAELRAQAAEAVGGMHWGED